ncbi:MAG: hypothetical protein O3B73_18995, partial [bacterium]|nr:hypothetical protein [bacterium]
FSLYFLAAAILWTPILVGLSYLIGHQLLAYFSVYEKYVIPVLLFAIFGLRGMVKFVLALINHRGRRLLLSAWRRKTRWEFWPIGFFYIPIVA